MQIHLAARPSLQQRTRRHRLWIRLAVVGVVASALLIGGLLVIFKPGTASQSTRTRLTPIAPTATASPLPPGTRWYYDRGQWQPLDQQP